MNNYFIRVYYEDTDAGGIVYYSNYLKFIERARTEALRDIGIIQSEIVDKFKLIFVVRNIFAEFIKPAKLDDLLEVKTNFKRFGKVSIGLVQEIFLNESKLFRAEVKLGIVDIKGKPKKLPLVLKEKMKNL